MTQTIKGVIGAVGRIIERVKIMTIYGDINDEYYLARISGGRRKEKTREISDDEYIKMVLKGK